MTELRMTELRMAELRMALRRHRCGFGMVQSGVLEVGHG